MGHFALMIFSGLLKNSAYDWPRPLRTYSSNSNAYDWPPTWACSSPRRHLTDGSSCFELSSQVPSITAPMTRRRLLGGWCVLCVRWGPGWSPLGVRISAFDWPLPLRAYSSNRSCCGVPYLLLLPLSLTLNLLFPFFARGTFIISQVQICPWRDRPGWPTLGCTGSH